MKNINTTRAKEIYVVKNRSSMENIILISLCVTTSGVGFGRGQPSAVQARKVYFPLHYKDMIALSHKSVLIARTGDSSSESGGWAEAVLRNNSEQH